MLVTVKCKMTVNGGDHTASSCTSLAMVRNCVQCFMLTRTVPLVLIDTNLARPTCFRSGLMAAVLALVAHRAGMDQKRSEGVTPCANKNSVYLHIWQ
jgi:hypothetical protein